MNAVFTAAAEVEAICRGAKFRFCFIGGIAVQRWGRPRMTVDVDLTVITGFGGEAPFVDALLAKLAGRISDAREFALRNRTVIATAANGVPVDISLGAMPFEEHSVERASGYEVAQGIAITTCSAEDLIVHKAFAGRAKDWLDLEGIIERQAATLDRELIFAELVPLLELKEDRTTEARLRAMMPG